MLTATLYTTISTHLCLWLDISSHYRYVKNVSLCFPRSHVPSAYPVSTTFSSSCLRITCQRNVICLLIMSCRSPFSTPDLRYTSHVLTLSVQGILNILFSNQCSVASMFSSSFGSMSMFHIRIAKLTKHRISVLLFEPPY